MYLPASRQSTAPSAESFGLRCGRLLARQIAVNGSCEQGPGAQATPSLKCTCTRRPALSTSADTQIKPSKGLVQPHLRVTRAWTAVRRCPKMVFWCSKTSDEHNVDRASTSVCPMRPRRTMPELSAAAATCQVTARWLESRHVACGAGRSNPKVFVRMLCDARHLCTVHTYRSSNLPVWACSNALLGQT